MSIIALLGPTASGKSELALRLAHRFHGIILSLDALAIYRFVDIASAKPTTKEREGILHFGIDHITPDMPFNAAMYQSIFLKAQSIAKARQSPLLIVGGSGFYLKGLLEGFSDTPTIDKAIQQRAQAAVEKPSNAYTLLQSIDPRYAQTIDPNDRYRIQKALALYWQTGTPPSLYFHTHPPKPLLKACDIYEISLDRHQLWERIRIRTHAMIEKGLIDEVTWLEKRYGRAAQPMHAIGIAEVLHFLDGRYDRATMIEKIFIHTRQLAKRQRTFNATQFPSRYISDPASLYTIISKRLERQSLQA